MAFSMKFLFLFSSLFIVSSDCYELKNSVVIPSQVCKDSTKGPQSSSSSSSIVLKIVHMHGPCNPNYQFDSTDLTQISIEDKARVDWIQSGMNNSVRGDNNLDVSYLAVPISSSTTFLVTIGLGTPKQDVSLIFDTASDLTWTQCQPCLLQCYHQKEPIFTPAKSESFKQIYCHSELCNSTQGPSCWEGSRCLYDTSYGDGSTSVGYLATDKMTLSTRTGDRVDKFDYNFGCGMSNIGRYGQSAGILGFGLESDLGFQHQTGERYRQFFGYCLPQTESSTGHLYMGRDEEQLATMNFTYLVSNPKYRNAYSMNLVAISVGGSRLPIDPSVFSNSGGIIIDSGTTITRLPPSAYSILRDQVRMIMESYGYYLTDPFTNLETCYYSREDYWYEDMEMPLISFTFEGNVEVTLDTKGTIYIVNSSKFCLAFAANSNDTVVSIFGSISQRNINIFFDLAKGVVGFGALGCA